MVFKVSDLLSLATELSNDNMKYVSFSEYNGADSSGLTVYATSSADSPESVDYEELESVPNVTF